MRRFPLFLFKNGRSLQTKSVSFCHNCTWFLYLKAQIESVATEKLIVVIFTVFKCIKSSKRGHVFVEIVMKITKVLLRLRKAQ